MTTSTLRALRLATTTAVAFAVLGGAPALAATDDQENQAVNATTNRLIQQAKSKLASFADGLSLSPASGTDVFPGARVLGRVSHTRQPSDELTGKVFIDAAAAIGELPVRFPATTFAARNPVTGAALPSSQARLFGVRSSTGKLLTDRRSVLLLPKFFQAGSATPAALARGLDARVPVQVDLPPLEQLANSMSGQLGRPAPASAQKLVAFVFDHLTPPGYGNSDGLCKFLPSDHAQFCGSVVDQVGDPDPTHQGLFAKMSDIDVTPAATEVVSNLTRMLDVLPLGIPSVSVWFRHKSFAVTDPSAAWTSAGFALLAVPPGTPGASTASELTAELVELRSTLAKLTQLTGLALLPGAVDRLVMKVNAYGGAGVRITSRAERDLDITMISRGFRNDIEAEDEISSAMVYGLPSGKWRANVHDDFGGSTLLISPDETDFLAERSDLHAFGFGDKLSSLRIEVNAKQR